MMTTYKRISWPILRGAELADGRCAPPRATS